MEYELVIPSLSTCALRIFDANEGIDEIQIADWHLHREYEMILSLSETKNFYIGNDEVELRSGDIIFINSNVPHKCITNVGSTSVLLQFNISAVGNLFEELKLSGILGETKTTYTVFESNSSINRKITTCINKIREEYSRQDSYFDYFIKSYLQELIALLYRHGILTDYNKFLEGIPNLLPVLKYISEHYNEHITLADVSKVANIHSSYFCKIFREGLGISFIEYLNLVRISYAKTLLETTQKNITEIAFDVGFSSVSYFIKTFKKYNYYSPNKYKSILEKK